VGDKKPRERCGGALLGFHADCAARRNERPRSSIRRSSPGERTHARSVLEIAQLPAGRYLVEALSHRLPYERSLHPATSTWVLHRATHQAARGRAPVQAADGSPAFWVIVSHPGGILLEGSSPCGENDVVLVLGGGSYRPSFRDLATPVHQLRASPPTFVHRLLRHPCIPVDCADNHYVHWRSCLSMGPEQRRQPTFGSTGGAILGSGRPVFSRRLRNHDS